jgi:hypothetical protein
MALNRAGPFGPENDGNAKFNVVRLHLSKALPALSVPISIYRHRPLADDSHRFRSRAGMRYPRP